MNKHMEIPKVIAALHLPPLPGSAHPDRKTMLEIRDFALRNSEMALQAGIQAIFLQDLGDHPVARPISPHIIAGVTAVGYYIHDQFPELQLGISLLGHGAKEPLAIAQAIGARFVRLKVYVGAMLKAEGLLEGCAAEAIQIRHQIAAEDIAIFADVYDRTGEPLGRMPFVEEVRQAAVFGRADGVVLTGKSFAETSQMIEEVANSDVKTPILIGGGVNAGNVVQALRIADSVIVSSSFKKVAGFTRESMLMDWDLEKMKEFMHKVDE
ncbi:MAG TPA: BtpA/SgcQ family protein [Anaerolineaceae bacterium]|nr:BtpA/SgcQ family protein [Anaerolineaceae bacterium]